MKNNIQVSIETISTEQVNSRGYFKIKYGRISDNSNHVSKKNFLDPYLRICSGKVLRSASYEKNMCPSSILSYDAQLRVLDICWVKTHTYRM